MSHDFDFRGAARRRAGRHHLLQHGVDADGAAHETARTRERQEVADDLGGPVGFAVDRLDLAAKLAREGPGRAKQLEMAQHTLQRVVQLVGDPRDELSERDQLLRLIEAAPELLSLLLHSGLRCQVPRHQDAADPIALVVAQRGDRDHERSLQDRIEHFDRHRRGAAGRRLVGGLFGEPLSQLRADELLERPLEQLVTREADAAGKRVVDVGDSPAAIPDGHQMRNRVEGVLELAPRPHQVVQELQVLHGARELTAELIGAIEHRQLAAGLDADALDERASRAPAGSRARGW